MRILFIFPRPDAYDSRTVREKPCGGTEKTVIFLGEAFQKLGHQVQWITSLEELGQPHERPDVVITQHAEFLEQYPDARRVFWSHHFTDQPITQQQAPFARCWADKIVTLSQCHQDDLKQHLRLDSVQIGHGVWLREVQCIWDEGDKVEWIKDPYRLIYASTPFRGLDRIPELFRAIREREPRATISICSSMATYGEPDQDAKYQKIFDELETIPGVELHGALNQAQLYAEYARASIFFYPCNWRETYCLALDEAMAHGCRPATTSLGALPERAGFTYTMQDLATIDVALTVCLGTWRSTLPRDWLEVAKQWEREVLA